METIEISCSDCTMQHTSACDDCLVTHLCGPAATSPPTSDATAVVLDLDEHRAMRRLADRGLVPAVRHTGGVRQGTM